MWTLLSADRQGIKSTGAGHRGSTVLRITWGRSSGNPCFETPDLAVKGGSPWTVTSELPNPFQATQPSIHHQSACPLSHHPSLPVLLIGELIEND